MKTQTTTKQLGRTVTGILAVLLPLLLSPANARAQEIEARLVEKTIEVAGNGWTLRYGANRLTDFELLKMEGARAYFAHHNWLRLIDTRRGVVIGRWRIPGQKITKLSRTGDRLEIEYEYHNLKVPGFFQKATYLFSPEEIPSFRTWSPGNLLLAKLPLAEVMLISPTPHFQAMPRKLGDYSPDFSTQKLPIITEMARRDPHTPWFQMLQGFMLETLKDPRADKILQKAAENPSADYTELIWMATYLDRWGKHELAKVAFEHGYRKFWQAGNDPRMSWTIINFLLLGASSPSKDDAHADTTRGLWLERIYLLAPFAEQSDRAWATHARNLKKLGDPDAQRWEKRANNAKGNQFHALLPGPRKTIMWGFLMLAASVFSVFIFFVGFRYRPKLSGHPTHPSKTKGQDSILQKYFPTFTKPIGDVGRTLNLTYWTFPQRVAFSVAAMCMWLSVGLIAQSTMFILRVGAINLATSGGAFASPAAVDDFMALRPTPERDLLIAISYHHQGNLDEAERRYRSLPQFAESWNNLGVILKAEGRGPEAKRAFQAALELNPNLHEASWNLGQQPEDEWTALHAKFLPDQPMLAPPTTSQMVHTYRGGTRAAVLLRAATGPFGASRVAEELGMKGGIFSVFNLWRMI